MIHTYVKLQDLFSGAYVERIVTQSREKHNKMVASIGSTFRHFDKAAQVASNYKVIEVRQAVQSDYKVVI